MEASATLPLDLFRLVCDYLYQSDSNAFGRLCICSRNIRADCVKGLSSIIIDYSSTIGASYFDGAQPRRVSVAGAPADAEEGQQLGNLFTMAQEISFYLEGISTDESQSLVALGPLLCAASTLDIEYDNDEITDVFCSWLSYAQNLTSLEVSWRLETPKLLASAAACEGLQTLILDNDSGEVFFPFVQVAPSLKGLKSLKTLVVSDISFDLSLMRLESANSPLEDFKQSLDNFAALLPESLQSLHNVFIRTRTKNTFEVPLFGYFYAHATHKTVCRFLHDKLIEIGPNKIRHEYGDSALVLLLATTPDSEYQGGEHTTSNEMKIRKLIEAGADPLRRTALPGFSGGISWGNALHVAAMYSSSEVMSDFITVLEKSQLQADINSMRTTEGFTPLHFAGQESDTWIALSDYLKQHVSPTVLTDIENALGVTPLTTIHLRIDPSLISPNCILEITEYILGNDPWASNAMVKAEQAKLFVPALDFFSSLLGTHPAHSEEDDVDEMDEAVPEYPTPEISVLLAKLLKTASPNGISEALATHKTLPVVAKRICGAFLLCPQEVRDKILAAASKQEISAALVALVSLHEIPMDVITAALPILLKAGADPNFVHPDVCGNCGVLGAFVATHTPSEENIIEEYYWESDCKSFWKVFWDLTAAGASPEAVSPQLLIFTQEPFAKLIRRSDQASQVERLKLWLQKLQASDLLAVLEAVLHLSIDDEGDQISHDEDGEEDSEDDEANDNSDDH